MALRRLVSRQNVLHQTPGIKPSFQAKEKVPQIGYQSNISRRVGIIAAVASVLAGREMISRPENGYGLDLEMVVPEQTIEEAKSRIRSFAEALLDIKALLETESWKEAQKALRKNSSNLKLDMYNIIQSKPGNERPQLRKLYFDLFNNVTKLDYAARDRDATRIWECYGNIVAVFKDILDRLLTRADLTIYVL